jgi:hypothetical protein
LIHLLAVDRHTVHAQLRVKQIHLVMKRKHVFDHDEISTRESKVECLRHTPSVSVWVTKLHGLHNVLSQAGLGPLLCTYLGADDIFSLPAVSRDCLQFTERLKRMRFLSKRVIAYLSQVHHLEDDFLQTLQDAQGLVSGSAMLQALCPDHAWSVGDVDVFHKILPGDNTDLPEKDARRNAHSDRGPMEHWADEQITDKVTPSLQCDRHYRHIDEMIHIYNYLLAPTNVRLQIITTQRDPMQFIVQCFDFDFLKITFDGRNVVVHKMQAVRTRQSYYFPMANDLHERLTLYRDRICKYRNRGFTIPNVDETERPRTCVVACVGESRPYQDYRIRVQTVWVTPMAFVDGRYVVDATSSILNDVWCICVHIQDMLHIMRDSGAHLYFRPDLESRLASSPYAHFMQISEFLWHYKEPYCREHAERFLQEFKTRFEVFSFPTRTQ